jgi:glycosyltransferase involved in cell wall biosynthesis
MTLVKQLRERLRNGDHEAARRIALEIEASDYPQSLKCEARKVLHLYGREQGMQADAYSTHLYRAISSQANSSKGAIAAQWLPWRIMLDGLGVRDQEASSSSALETYTQLYLAKGSSVLHYLKEINTKTIESAISDCFDYEYYLESHPDMRGLTRHEALHHYAVFGGTEPSRKPNRLFSNEDIFRTYPWTKKLNINALYLFSRWPEQFPELTRLIEKRFILRKRANHFPWKRSAALNATTIDETANLDYQRILAVTKESSSKKRCITPNDNQMNIHFVIPDFTKGGGGHMTIFRMILHLENAGHKCTVWVKDYDYRRHPEGPQISAVTHYQPIKAQVLPLSSHFAFCCGDALIATSWDTVEIVSAHKSFIDYFYLVQDYEPYFFPRGADALEAELTYTADLKTICASLWLDKLMRDKFNRTSMHFNLSYNPSIYNHQKTSKESQSKRVDIARSNETGDQSNPIIRIAFYSRLRTDRRAVSLALKGLQRVNQCNFTICIELFGEQQGKVSLPSNVIGFDNGILTPQQLAELYHSCDIGLTFSATNYALVPQEMMACGLPVIEINNDSTRAIYPEDVLVLAEPSAQGIAEAIEKLATDTKKRLEIARKGLEWVRQSSWELSFKQVESFIRQEVKNSASQHNYSACIKERYLAADHEILSESEDIDYCATVVIPTHQGGTLLQEVLSNVKAQATEDPFEIIIIDSSSTDGSIESISVLPNMAIYRIDKTSFQHGKTRNLAVALSKAPLVAFITQDAIPASNNWLANLIRPLQDEKEVQAVFGSHRAHREHPKHLDTLITSHFKAYKGKEVQRKTDDLKSYYSENPSHRQFMHYYSDNNSCLRKEAWNQYPYPDVFYGEDQLYADWIIQTGGAKAYAADAAVFHSHDYDQGEEFARAKTEAMFFMKYFGYNLSQDRVDLEEGLEQEAKQILASREPALDPYKAHFLGLIREKREGYRAGLFEFSEWLKLANLKKRHR